MGDIIKYRPRKVDYTLPEYFNQEIEFDAGMLGKFIENMNTHLE
jgi:hypothetical protein